MSLRIYITFAVVFIALQCLVYIFNRTVRWLFNGKLNHRQSRMLLITSYLLANSLILIHIFQIYPTYRESAFLLTFLLFSAMVRLVLWIVGKLFKSSPRQHLLRWLYPVGVLGLLGVSVYNAYTPKIVHYQIQLDKPMQPLRIGMASDLHLGSWFGGKELDQLADIMQQQKVDLILLPGDLMDDDVTAYVHENMRPHLAKLQAPLGVFATLGNHDIKDRQHIISEIQKAGIQLLQDESLTLKQGIVLIGRNDDLVQSRPSTAELLKNVDTNLPVILLDHRPSEIEQHANLPIDIQLSGHTHNGQIFPLNFIVKPMYRLSYGYEKIGNPHVFVSSGYGFWGIPLRLGSQSEVMIIDVKGK